MKRTLAIMITPLIFLAFIGCIFLGIALSPSFSKQRETSITTIEPSMGTFVIPEITSELTTEPVTELIDPVKYYNWYWYTDNWSIPDNDNPACETFDEYNAFIHHFSQALPENFITYDDLADIGAFDLFVMVGSGGFQAYAYVVRPSETFAIDIAIFHMADGESSEISDQHDPPRLYIPSSDEDTSDMRTSIHTVTTVRLHNADYLYGNNGELIHIITYIDGYQITIKGASIYDGEEFHRCSISDYDLSNENFITLLLLGAEREAVEKAFWELIK